MDDFRKTQRNDYPAICNAIDGVWSVLHLSIIFDLDDEPTCEADAGPAFQHSFPVAQEPMSEYHSHMIGLLNP